MNHDSEHSSNTDPAVSAAYRAIATETAPPRLDDIVLRKAAKETNERNRLATFLSSVRRPLAFAATLVLALSIVLQFEEEIAGTTQDSTNGVMQSDEASSGLSQISTVVDENAEHIQEQMQQSERVMTEGLLNQPAPESDGVTGAGNPDTVRFCNSEQTASPERWWACVTDLESDGRYDAAAHERQLLTNTYPDFSPAE
jgi:hypothetical protein